VNASLWWLRASGWAPAIVLALSLAVTPCAGLVRRVRGAAPRGAASVRRALGITAAALALGHAVVALKVYVPRPWFAVIRGVPWLLSGALALAVLVALLVTSFPAPTRVLRVRAWKPLHRLAYVAAALVAHHLAVGPLAPRAWVIAWTVVLAVVLALRAVSCEARATE
jgi:sulfoxide reductase heme-binding subunit YedZ